MSRLLFQCRHRYSGGFALDAEFEAGDGVTAIFGPSGSGKTTMLSVIAGTLRPQEARVQLDGRTLVDTAGRLWLPPDRRGVGFVFQDLLLFPHMTVRSNLRYGAKRRPERTADFDGIVKTLELGELLNRYPHTLSGGQRQRVALGRALLRGPRLLLMDEPLTALDDALKDRVLTYVERAIHEYAVPTLFVAHEVATVRRLADRVIAIEHGRIIGSGPPEDVLERSLEFRAAGSGT